MLLLMNTTNTPENTMIEQLATEMKKLGWTVTTDGEWLRISEALGLRTPEVRDDEKGVRYVWDGYVAQKPATMAKRLDRFLRDGGKRPAPKAKRWVLVTNHGGYLGEGTATSRKDAETQGLALLNSLGRKRGRVNY